MKFRVRVHLERRALRAVNLHIPARQPLGGISHAAVSHWKSGIDWAATDKSEQEVVSALAAIYRASQSLADQSRGVFDREDFDENKVKALVRVLECYLSPDDASDERLIDEFLNS